jgi:hypothetical protein
MGWCDAKARARRHRRLFDPCRLLPQLVVDLVGRDLVTSDDLDQSVRVFDDPSLWLVEPRRPDEVQAELGRVDEPGRVAGAVVIRMVETGRQDSDEGAAAVELGTPLMPWSERN